MRTYTETIPMQLQLPVAGEYDVIVVGGGPSGCTAATAAARVGKRTLLIEGTGALGGMGTMGLVPGWCPFSDMEKIIYKGLGETVYRQSHARHPAMHGEPYDWAGIYCEGLKRTLDELVTGAGVVVLFQTMLCDVLREGGRVTGILVSNKSGLSVYRAKVFVDCTGDADLAIRAGASYESGDDVGLVQPSTHCFVLSNVDMRSYRGQFCNHIREIANAIRDDPELDLIGDGFVCTNTVGPDAVGFNAGHIWELDSSDPMALSQAYIRGRKMAEQFLIGLNRHSPADHTAFRNAYVSQTAPLMGIRESRRVCCDYTLTGEDYNARRSFDDEIGRSCYYVDTHPTSRDIEAGIDPSKKYEYYRAGESFGIPYRSLCPVGLDNVLVAGRCIGSDHAANGSIRVMPPCFVTGEAAGCAAAYAASLDTPDIRKIDVTALQEDLLSHGAYLHTDV